MCAGALDFEDAIYLLHERGQAMQNAVPVGAGAMLAVLGLKTNEVVNLLDEKNKLGVCEIANDNANGQVIISGDTESINSVQKILKKKLKQYHLKLVHHFIAH